MYILITAYEKYALEGFNLNVVDYLVKPVELPRFFQACSRAKEKFDLRQNASSPTPPKNEFIFVNMDYSQHKINKSDILWVEGLKDYLKIHLTSNQRPIVTRMSMGAMEQELAGGKFIRIHKSYIISLQALSSYKKSSVFINDLELPLGESYRDAFLKFVGGN